MKLKRVMSNGFKGADFAYDLTAPLCLFGDNGAGKSRVLQAIHYALSGDVPTGRHLDQVALYFPPRGGTVTLVLENGESLTRGITVDAEKKKNSELLQIEAADGAFKFSSAVLDIRTFLDLSPNSRREFIMELVATSAKEINLIDAISHQFAVEIGGKAANAQWLINEKSPISSFYLSNHGILEHLSSIRTAGLTLGAICNTYLEEAKGLKLAARKRATEAKAAIRELEPEARAKENAAKALPAAREAELALSSKAKAHLGRLKRMEECQKATYERAERLLALKMKRNSVEVQAGAAKEPEALPSIPDEVEKLRVMNDSIQQAEHQKKGLEQLIDEWQDLQSQRDGLNQDIEVEQKELDRLLKQPLTALSHLLDTFRDGLHPEMRKAKALAKEAAAGEIRQFNECSDNISLLQTKLEKLQAKATVQENVAKDAKAALKLLENDLAVSKKGYSDLFGRTSAAQRDYQEAVRTRDARILAGRANERLLQDLDTQIRLAGEEHEKADAAYQEAIAALEEAPEAEDPSTMTEALKQATTARELAEQALGAWDAYQKAIASAEAAKVEEEAWKTCEKAVQTVREEYVGATTAGLMQDLTDYWRSSGRQELPYLLLENERGKAVFELGLLRGEERIALGALSEGEQLLFTISLAYTICRRDKGLKPLLIEADPLQAGNFADLLAWLDNNLGCFDCIVVAKGGEPVPLPNTFESEFLS